MLSIITPVLNGEKFIRDNIESISKLSIPFEHIIVDGQSTDKTLSIINEYPSVTVLQQKGRKGMYQAIHQGFEIAKGDFISWINSDDQIVCKGFVDMYNFLIRTQNSDLVYSNSVMKYTKEDLNKIIKGRYFGKQLMKGGYIPFVQPSFMCRKELYFGIGGFSYDKYKIIGDKDLFCRMARYSKKDFSYVNVTSSVFLKHGNSLGDNNEERYLIEKRDSLEIDNLFYSLLRVTTKLISKI